MRSDEEAPEYGYAAMARSGERSGASIDRDRTPRWREQAADQLEDRRLVVNAPHHPRIGARHLPDHEEGRLRTFRSPNARQFPWQNAKAPAENAPVLPGPSNSGGDEKRKPRRSVRMTAS